MTPSRSHALLALAAKLEAADLLRHVEGILVRGIAAKRKYDQNDPAACLLGWCGSDDYFKSRETPERNPRLTAYDELTAALGHDAVCDLITFSEKKRTAAQQLELFRAAALKALAAAEAGDV